ncbi:hypothetical protein [Streptomyces sp. NRRL F-5755]|uniref:hypothetical protein n=1 Tax=Streptomyces sp. NRRL F-5755 TaxID=1519475 RepID=UPI0013316AD6|nr:hypothetical protein [Streptomyces sp. NRRL F-5755]
MARTPVEADSTAAEVLAAPSRLASAVVAAAERQPPGFRAGPGPATWIRRMPEPIGTVVGNSVPR